ncbi:MAG: phage terminase small subunit P27 family [Desulfatibacillaceae bacterium]|nr:phage terminase small subunit P27 family [Desulfatibacillaceae bacterium]
MPRKAKPLNLRILEGNPSKRALPTGCPEPPEGLPQPPPHLDKGALVVWNQLAPGLIAMKLLSVVDVSSFSAYCVAISRWAAAEIELQKLAAQGESALIFEQKNKLPRQHPLVSVSNESARLAMSLASEFGLTPSARARLGVKPTGGKKSKFDGLIGG